MGFLDKKERILDIVLTQEGRKLLSQNDLDFSYYAFSDDGINYSGSLDDARSKSINIDKYIPNENLLEATSDNDSIKYNLYTFDETSDTMPEFRIKEEDINSGLNFSLKRSFLLESDPKVFASHIRNNTYGAYALGEENVSAIVRAEIENENQDVRNEDKAITDLTIQSIKNMQGNGLVAGSVIGKNYIAINELEAIDKRSGETKKISNININERSAYFNNLDENIEVILGRDSVELNFEVKNSSGKINTSGFLVSVYESGSDGKLRKMPAEDIIRDVESGEIKEEGFLNFLEITTDEGEA